jgi:hypothetical protein
LTPLRSKPQCINLQVNADATRAVLTTDLRSVPFLLPGENALSALRDGIAERLNQFVQVVCPGVHDDSSETDACTDTAKWVPVTYPAAEEALDQLRNLGSELASQFFGGSDQVEAAAAAIREVVPDWRYSDGRDVAFVFEAPLGAMFPVELLPLFDYSSRWQVSDAASLADAARCLLGFGTVISRVIRDSPYRSSRSFAGDCLRIRMFQDASLRGAKKEVEYFNEMIQLAVDGPWPETLQEDEDLRGVVARTTLDSAYQLDGTIDVNRWVHFVHFACHSRTITPPASDYQLSFQGSHGGQRWVSLGQLRQGMAQHYPSMPQGRRNLPRPVVVMNSCGATSLDPRTARSFPELFLAEHLAGFVGPETVVPDGVAALFSRLFYDAIIRRRWSIGQSLHHAKWTILTRWANPLGVLWTAYVDPDYRPLGEDHFG